MKHLLKQRVYYGDTDAYGVVWHGTYLRWMEAGRVEFCSEAGLDLVELKKNDIVLPVTNINIRYKSSAKLDDNIIIETKIVNITPILVKFAQSVKNAETNQVYITAEVDVVAVNNEGRLYRRMPEVLKNVCERAMECSD
jgi:acyl-CoA thioester hydrolase